MRINYIEQINAFERWLETHYLPATAQLLYYKLLSINNKAGWCEWMQVDNQRVMSHCQMSREATLISNRNKLISAGLIEFQKGKKSSPNKYKICTFKSVGQIEVQSEVNRVVNSEVQTVAIYKQKQKQNNIARARASKNKFNNFNQRSADIDEAVLIDNNGG